MVTRKEDWPGSISYPLISTWKKSCNFWQFMLTCCLDWPERNQPRMKINRQAHPLTAFSIRSKTKKSHQILGNNVLIHGYSKAFNFQSSKDHATVFISPKLEVHCEKKRESKRQGHVNTQTLLGNHTVHTYQHFWESAWYVTGDTARVNRPSFWSTCISFSGAVNLFLCIKA